MEISLVFPLQGGLEKRQLIIQQNSLSLQVKFLN